MVSQKIKDLFKKESFLNVLLIILPVLFVLYRLYKFLISGPNLFPDSKDYLAYAGEILKGNFVSPDAKRTPGYPFFIALSYMLFGNRPDSVIWLQIITGLLSQYILIKLLKALRFSTGMILAILLIYLLSPLAYIDLNVLTESFTVLLFLSFFLFLHKYLTARKIFFFILILISSEFLVFTRPQFIVFVILADLFFLYKKEKLLSWSLLIIVLLTTLTWSLINLEKNKYFGMSSYMGFNLINHTGYFIDKEKDINPVLVKIYLNKRNEIEKKYPGRQEFAIWGCKDEIMKVEGYNFTDLARELTRISLILIIRHPWSYLYSVSNAIYNSVVWSDTLSPGENNIRLPSSIMELIFCSGIIFLLLLRGENYLFQLMKLLFVSNLLFSSLMERGENFRYNIPLLFIIFIYFVPGVYLIFKKKLRVNEILH